MHFHKLIKILGTWIIFLFPCWVYGQLKFIPNKGQWPAEYLAKAHLSQGEMWITPNGLVFQTYHQEDIEKMHNRSAHEFNVRGHNYLMRFVNGNCSNIDFLGEASAEYYNFYLGQNAHQWKTGIHAYPSVRINHIYPGVHLLIKEINGNLKYDLELNASEDLSKVKIAFEGLSSIFLRNSQLVLTTTLDTMVEYMPEVYGDVNGERVDIQAAYLLDSNTISYQLDLRRKPNNIVIDPVLVFSTFSGSRADNFGCTGTYDDLGNGYAGGTVFNAGFPVTLGAWQTNFGGGTFEQLGYGGARDAGILKFSSNGSQLIYATYLGGLNNEQPHSMVVNSSGELFVMGSTRSLNFPRIFGDYDTDFNGDYDFFVSKFTADGRTLLHSTFIGGSGMDAVGSDRENNDINLYPLLYNYADEFRGEIICDSQSNVYIAGCTFSSNFPLKNSSMGFGSFEDAVIFALDSNLNDLIWSTTFGGNRADAAYGIALGKNNDLYVSGGTASLNIGSRTTSFIGNYLGGEADGFLIRMNKSTGTLLMGIYAGSNRYDQAYFVQTDNAGNPYIYGQTEGNLGLINANFGQANSGQFIMKFNVELTNKLRQTTVGTGTPRPNLSPSAFLVDQCERIFISGWGGNTNSFLIDPNSGEAKRHRNIGNTNGLMVTSDAYQRLTDGSDFYVAVLNKDFNNLLYATYFGGRGTPTREAEEHVDGGTSRFDKKGIIYQSVCAGCRQNGTFPTTPGAYSRTMGSTNCNNALFKIDFEKLNRAPVMRDTFIEVIATNSIVFALNAIDPDPTDSVIIELLNTSLPNGFPGPLPNPTYTRGVGSAQLLFNWTPNCNQFSADTLIFRFLIRDKGCPSADTTFATIKIKVNEPPIIIPPDAICVVFDRQLQRLRIEWPSSATNAYFKQLVLKRRNPDGSLVILQNINQTNGGSFTDISIVNPYEQNYCYFLTGINVCDVETLPTQEFCTVRELNKPIDSTYLYTVTVIDDKMVKVQWFKSQEPDFSTYEVYRAKNGSEEYQLVKVLTNLNDTFMLDSSFDVDAESWCYRIVVSDLCGHISRYSNKGCNIIIRGFAVGQPWYYFNLNWDLYEGWKGSVIEHQLDRSIYNQPLTFRGFTQTQRTFTDNQLPFDWGGYDYRVTAFEGNDGYTATSTSNTIYLFQPPEVYVPSGITRNNDGLNDTWGTVPVYVKSYHMAVYNRWGEKIWETFDKKQQWDGKVNGVEAHDAVFAWLVEFTGWDNKNYRKTGTVTVIH